MAIIDWNDCLLVSTFSVIPVLRFGRVNKNDPRNTTTYHQRASWLLMLVRGSIFQTQTGAETRLSSPVIAKLATAPPNSVTSVAGRT